MVEDGKVFISPLLINFDLGHTMKYDGDRESTLQYTPGECVQDVLKCTSNRPSQPALSSVRYMKCLAVKEFIDKN